MSNNNKLKFASENNETANILSMMKPRISAREVARVSGVKQRTITQWAHEEKIPGAVKLGNVWRFDPDKILQWVRNGKWQEISTNKTEANTITSASPSTASNGESRFAQLINGSRKGGQRAG